MEACLLHRIANPIRVTSATKNGTSSRPTWRLYVRTRPSGATTCARSSMACAGSCAPGRSGARCPTTFPAGTQSTSRHAAGWTRTSSRRLCTTCASCCAWTRGAAGSNDSRQIEGMAQGPGPRLDRRFCPTKAPLCRIQGSKGVGDHLVHTLEAGALAQFRADRGGARGANVGDLLQALALRIVSPAVPSSIGARRPSRTGGAAVRPSTVRIREAGAVGFFSRSFPPTDGPETVTYHPRRH
jgi:hypothetical protein